jgi:thiol-disulfide isomerase/thioredoxin
MKKIIGLILLFISISICGLSQGYKIKFDIKNLNDSVVYLARYFGDNKYIKDTIVIEGKEKFVIEGDDDLECGIYMIVREKRNAYFEFIVNNQKFSVISDTIDFVGRTEFKNSPENEKLYAYFRFTGERGEQLQDSSLSSAERKKIHQEIAEYKKDFIRDNPDNPMTVVFLMQEEVTVPQFLKDKEGEGADRERYYYYYNHYWDKVDFNSSCLLRTPLFHGKMQRYFDKIIPQHYDSIPIYADLLIEKSRVNPEVFKYIVNYLTFKWESGKQKRMCWDKVFYHMAKSYYLTLPETQTPWVEEGQMAKIKTRAQDLKYCLCGEKAVPLQMKYKGNNYGAIGLDDTLLNRVDLYSVPADYVIMWFWDSDCGHCKKQTPKLWDVYQKYKNMGASLEVYAINIEQETPSYLKYLREKNYSWINVQDTAHLTKFRDYYDIYSTPVAFVLDKERNIIGKRIDPPALDDFLKEIFRQEGLNVEVNDKNDAVENIKSFSKSSLLKDKQSKSKDEN